LASFGKYFEIIIIVISCRLCRQLKTTVSWYVSLFSSVNIYLHIRIMMKQLVFPKRRYLSNSLPCHILGDSIMLTVVKCMPLVVCVNCSPV